MQFNATIQTDAEAGTMDLGPGCCVLKRGNVTFSISNVGSRDTCEDLAKDFGAKIVSYTQGEDC